MKKMKVKSGGKKNLISFDWVTALRGSRTRPLVVRALRASRTEGEAVIKGGVLRFYCVMTIFKKRTRTQESADCCIHFERVLGVCF